jgi:hypothetical protein
MESAMREEMGFLVQTSGQQERKIAAASSGFSTLLKLSVSLVS